jgi:hypothetical protein
MGSSGRERGYIGIPLFSSGPNFESLVVTKKNKTALE